MRVRYLLLTVALLTISTPAVLASSRFTNEQQQVVIVHNGDPIPAQFVSELISKSPVPVVLPRKLSVHSQPDPGLVLVAEVQVSHSGYQISLYWRNKNHLTQDLGLANCVGSISGQQGRPPTHAVFSYASERTVRLSDGATATEYSAQPPIPTFGGQSIVWSVQKWTFTTMGIPDTSSNLRTETTLTNLGLARVLNSFIAQHGVPLRTIKRAFVEQVLEPDHDECDVDWTYNGGTWYSIDGYDQNPNDVLTEVHSSIRFTRG